MSWKLAKPTSFQLCWDGGTATRRSGTALFFMKHAKAPAENVDRLKVNESKKASLTPSVASHLLASSEPVPSRAWGFESLSQRSA